LIQPVEDKQPNRKIIFSAEIEISPTRTEILVFREGASPTNVVELFCSKHNLNAELKALLSEQLDENLKKYHVKKKQQEMRPEQA